MNGDNEDFDAATEEVNKSNPVIALKNVGGASENIARIFEEFHEVGRVRKAEDKRKRDEVARRRDGGGRQHHRVHGGR